MTTNQKKIEKTCNYIMHNQTPCGKRLYDNSYCILHSKNIQEKKADFEEQFHQEFDRQKSQEDVYDFTGFVFPDDIFFFEGISFEKKVYFNNAKFSGRVNFSTTHFCGEVNFGGAQFVKPASFGRSRFSGTTHFSRAQFSGDVSFAEAEFHDSTFFWNIQFNGRAKFIAGKFTKSTDFRQAQFAKNAEFANTHFSGRVDFGDTQFREKADFNQADFFGGAAFWQTIFHEKASFRGCQFSKKTDFKQTHFSEEVVFTEAQFLEKTSFWGAQFFNKADFVRVQFHAEANFVSTQFSGKTLFNQAKFNELANFDNFSLKNFGDLFMEECYFFDTSGLLEFIEQNKKKFKFSRRPHKNEFLPDQSSLILGEKAAAKYSLIDRKIRDDLFLLSFRKRHPVWLFLWWFSTDCGRSFRVLGAWCFIMAIFFALLYCLVFPLAFEMPKGSTWISYFYFSIVTFTTLGFGDISPTAWYTQVLVTLEVMVGYGMLGLLISIMANKLARRS